MVYQCYPLKNVMISILLLLYDFEHKNVEIESNLKLFIPNPYGVKKESINFCIRKMDSDAAYKEVT